MKMKINRYLKIIAFICIGAILILFSINRICVYILNSFEIKANEIYTNSSDSINAPDYINGYELDLYYSDVDRIKGIHNKEKILLNIGSSLTMRGAYEGEISLENYEYNKFCVSGMTLQDEKLCIQYLEEENIIGDGDIILISFSSANFVDKDYEQRTSIRAINMWGEYCVTTDNNQTLVKNSFSKIRMLSSRLFQPIKNCAWMFEKAGKSIIKNKTLNWDRIVEDMYTYEYVNWKTIDRNFEITDEKEKEFEGFLMELSQKYNLIVEIAYNNTEFHNSQEGKMYDYWIDNEFQEFTKKNNIYCIDNRYMLKDNDYSDGSHLNKFGREKYTEGLQYELNEYLKKRTRNNWRD